MRHILSGMRAIPLLAFGCFAAFGSAHAQESSFPAGVTGTPWKLLEIERSAQDILSTSNVNITLSFDGQGLAGGNSACNFYSAPYQTGAGQALTFDPLISTLRACADASLMNLETEYYSALDGVASYSFDGTTLQLFYNNGGSVLRFGTTAAPPVPGMPRTGGAGSNYTILATAGALLALLGAACLLSRQVTRPRR